MRIRLRHDMTFAWDRPVRSVLQLCRLTPRDHEAQHIVDWRLGTDVDCRLSQGEDAFGNITHSCSAEGPLTSFGVTIEGLVLTIDLAGIVRGNIERFPPALYLRETVSTAPGPALRAFAEEATSASGGPLDSLHRLMAAVYERMSLGEGDAEAGAAAAFDMQHGTAADIVHVLIAAARHIGVPARFVSGYLVADGRAAEHRWAEAHVDGLGWIGFDPLLDMCPQEAHVRVAMGLDAPGAAPVRCAPSGFAVETVTSSVSLIPEGSARQGQRQSQG